MKSFLLIGLFLISFGAKAQLVPGPPAHPPTPPNPPPYHGGCLYDLCDGDTVFNVSLNYRKAVIVAIETKGTYVLRFLDNNGVGGNWSRSDLAATRGCLNQICVGERAYNIARDYRLVQVVGFQTNGTYVVQFLDNNGVGGNWSRMDLALMKGCLGRVCVGQQLYNVSRDYRMVQVEGLQYDGRFVVRFLDNNGVGGNWTEMDFAFPYGCGPFYCVGQNALNIKMNYRKVQIMGIEYKGTYVLRFLDTNGIGGNWADADLVRAP